jgi:putative transposase
MIDKEHPLPVTTQCRILDLSRSGIYYTPVPVSDKDRKLMRMIDEVHLELPHLGSRGMKSELKSRGYISGSVKSGQPRTLNPEKVEHPIR